MRLSSFTLAVIATAWFGLLTPLSVTAVEAGDEAPAWQAFDFDGNAVVFPALLQDEPVVMIFWATWCSYCKAFMPFLEQIEEDYREHGIRILTVNAKEDGSGDPRAYIDALGFPMTAVRNGDSIARAYDVEFIPGLMVIDGRGQVFYRRPWTDLPAGRTVAELWDGQVREALDALLAADP
jgi:thiol-disulfide isomerase/thioredoxin